MSPHIPRVPGPSLGSLVSALVSSWLLGAPVHYPHSYGLHHILAERQSSRVSTTLHTAPLRTLFHSRVPGVWTFPYGLHSRVSSSLKNLAGISMEMTLNGQPSTMRFPAWMLSHHVCGYPGGRCSLLALQQYCLGFMKTAVPWRFIP